jgi:5-methylcytosine-specific restriction protein A
MARALKLCSQAGCYELTRFGRCEGCRKAADAARGTAAQRGYDSRWDRVHRPACLRRDPLCVCREAGHGHGGQCLSRSTVADHWPMSRRELVAQGVPDPDAPHRLRGICSPCHNAHTAVEQPGGWASRP